MNWQPLVTNGNIRGFEARTSHAHFFFGTRFTAKEDLSQLYPQYEFCFLKQVHGKRVIEADPQILLEADAHYSSHKNRALVIQTADCLPILLANSTHAVAIHAGWRGIAQNIIGACAPLSLSVPIVAAVGPHIQRPSFEVGIDVAEQLEAMRIATKPFVFPHDSPEKRWVDLSVLAEKQLIDLSKGSVKIAFLDHDTVTNPLFHSFRRGKQTPDRQYSFVVITGHS